jgi:hypothetical protein
MTADACTIATLIDPSLKTEFYAMGEENVASKLFSTPITVVFQLPQSRESTPET